MKKEKEVNWIKEKKWDKDKNTLKSRKGAKHVVCNHRISASYIVPVGLRRAARCYKVKTEHEGQAGVSIFNVVV